MIIKVKRMAMAEYEKLLASWGHKARYMLYQVPSTIDDVRFQGCFIDDTHQEIAVAWPVDRPAVAQEDYSYKYRCGYPVDEFEIKDTMNRGEHEWTTQLKRS